MNLEAIGQRMAQSSERLFGFTIFFFIILFAAIYFAIGIILCVWVYRDARSRGMDGTLWVIIVLIANILGLIVYLVVRKDRTIATMPREGIRYCQHCGHQISTDAKFCDNCGKQIKLT